jgi:PAS domain S-box-containing protein
LSSILLSVRETVLLSIAHFAALIVLFPQFPNALIFVAFLSSLIILAAFVVQADLAQINRQTRERAESERRFRALIEHSSDAVALMTPDGRVLYQSPSAARILAFPLEELLQHSPLAQLHSDDQPAGEALLATILREPERLLTARLRTRHADGSWRVLEITARNLLAEPAVKAIVGNYHDITERVRIEESLLQSEERFRLAAKATQDMIWDWDIPSGIETFSAAFQRVLGYGSQSIQPTRD